MLISSFSGKDSQLRLGIVVLYRVRCKNFQMLTFESWIAFELNNGAQRYIHIGEWTPKTFGVEMHI